MLKLCDFEAKCFKFKQLCIYYLQKLNRFNTMLPVHFLTYFRYGLCKFARTL